MHDDSSAQRPWRARLAKADSWVLRGFLLVAGAAAVGEGLISPIWDWIQGRPLATSLAVDAGAVPAASGRGVDPRGLAEVDVEITDPSVVERLAVALPGFATAATVFVAVVLVARFAKDLSRGEPFSRRNVWRFRSVAFAMVGGSLATAVADSVRQQALAVSDRLSASSPFAFTLTLPPAWIAAALVLAAVAEAFAHGARLREDVEGLI